ncbi:hypothetical protein LCGC14_0223420 [marine sediment metagenome]|uniref:Gingipain domain-containing protein n=1 Tax=marine sediment metagenome TaxID=412755 RepID=A0A0F9UGI4_9ZZZZ|nr:hypothetical protein [bacterium]
MNKAKILIISPLQDIPTITSNLAIAELMNYAATKYDLDIDYLWGLGANRAFFSWKTALKKGYDLIIYYGHGEKNRLIGINAIRSIINIKNIHKLKGAGVSTMACLSLKELGVAAIKKGVKAYIGTDELYYAAFPEKEYNYLSSWIDYTTVKDKAILDGKTFGEAYNLFVKRATKYLNIYKAKSGYRNYDWYAKSTEWNIKHTKLIGDPNTKIN